MATLDIGDWPNFPLRTPRKIPNAYGRNLFVWEHKLGLLWMRSQRARAAGVLVPETAMHENRLLATDKGDVWPARQVLPMNTIAIALGEEQSPDAKLRLGISPTVAAHDRRYGGR